MGRQVGSPTKTTGKKLLYWKTCFSVFDGELLVDGIKIPVRLGFKDIDGITGKFWANPGVSDTGEGRVMNW